MLRNRQFPSASNPASGPGVTFARPWFSNPSTSPPAQERRIDTSGLERGETVMLMPTDSDDALESIVRGDRTDWMLLRLVLCAGLATLLIALASSLGR